LHKRLIAIIFSVGFAVVAGLMLFGMWNDLSKLNFFSWLESFVK
jgi:membrane-associated protease RseP (regulator of RpoE activity)